MLPTNGIIILVKPLQDENALYPMLLTEFGIIILSKLLQDEKTYWPMLVTLYVTPSFSIVDGISTLASLPTYLVTIASLSCIIYCNPFVVIISYFDIFLP